LDTVTPDQYTRAQLEEATIVCSEHAYRVHHFDNNNFNAVLLVNDTDLVDTTGPVTEDDDARSHQDISNTEPDTDDDDNADARSRIFKVQDPDYDKFRPLFGWMNTKTNKKTLEQTTQYARMPNGTILKKHYKSPFPNLNVQRRDERLTRDTIYSNAPDIDRDETCAQIFVDMETLVTDVYGMKTEKHQQHQNPCERCYQTLKTMSDAHYFGSFRFFWVYLVTLSFVVLLQLTYNWTLGGIPLQYADSSTRDKSLTIILHRSNLRSAKKSSKPNLCLDPLDGENLSQSPQIVKSVQADAEDISDQVKPMIYFDTGDHAGQTFLMEEDDGGLRFRACIIEVLDDHKKNVANNPVLKKFKCLLGEDKFEEILSYNEKMQHIEKNNDDGETFWKYKWISGHKCPLNKNHSSWKGDMYNVKVEWENGEVSYEPLHTIASNDPVVVCAIYGKDDGLLDTNGRKRFHSLAKRAKKKMLCMVNQSKLWPYKTREKYMYGFEISLLGYEDAISLDKLHANDNRQNATKLEMDQLHEYNTFHDKGIGTAPGEEFKI
jgi:hypothetical protein